MGVLLNFSLAKVFSKPLSADLGSPWPMVEEPMKPRQGKSNLSKLLIQSEALTCWFMLL